MADRLVLSLREPGQARKAVDYLYEQAKPRLMAGYRLVAKLEPETRRDNHNRHYHSLIAQIAKQSRDFTIKLARAFIEWLYALGAEYGVQFKAWEGDDAR